jgi:hypothetical protein
MCPMGLGVVAAVKLVTLGLVNLTNPAASGGRQGKPPTALRMASERYTAPMRLQRL